MIKVQNNRSQAISYFRFFASAKYPNCFWHTKTTESFAFDLSRKGDYAPLNKTWKEVENEES
jgi:hypothetical protein